MDINSINIKTESHIVTPESFDVGSAVGVDKRYCSLLLLRTIPRSRRRKNSIKRATTALLPHKKMSGYGAPDGAYLSTVWSSLPLYLYIVQSVSAEL